MPTQDHAQSGRDIWGANDQDLAMSDQYVLSGTLNQGYGQGQQGSEEQWPQQGSQIHPDQTDPMRGDITASASDRYEHEMRDHAVNVGDTDIGFDYVTGGVYSMGGIILRDW